MMQDFWWSNMAKFSKIHWMSWEKMGTAKSAGGLGFRDLSIFNKAFLAKLLWRFQQNPDSLVAQIYKAKYFPGGTILGATIGTKPSYAWRSMLAASELLRQGLVWSVGNGLSIPIWGARWLPTPTSFLVQTAPRMLPFNSIVSCLIDLDTKRWNLDLLSVLFNEEEARVISNIPISPSLHPDRLVWQGTSNGLFLVRSAYHLGKELHQRSLGACSNSGKEADSWRVIWNLKVPNTVKVFMSRACHDILPTRVNLFKRKVVETSLCLCCKLGEETTIHALWSCPTSRDVWGCGPKIFQKSYS
jgi:hypothetical protein